MSSPPTPGPRHRRPPGAYIVALTLAVGICTALNLFTLASLWDAIASAGPGLSENATQILTGWGGGIIGIIGSVVGYTAGHTAGTAQATVPAPPESDVTPRNNT